MNVEQAKGQRIVIAGGGTAGWMAANLLAKSWQGLGVELCLIESPDIGIIGVGEGSTPQLKGFMDYIGVAEHEWMPACHATYKTGINFENWSTKAGFSSYFHPFPAQPDDYTAPAFFYNSFVRRKGVDVEGHPDHFFLASYLAKHHLAPIAGENFPFEINYGYHFNSGLLGEYLAKIARSRGVRHIQRNITEVKLTSGGEIAGLLLADGQLIEGDIFFDCTGFSALLMQQTLQAPFQSFAENLFNDSAVVVQTANTGEIESQTRSIAMQHGWRWRIPLTNRVGNGYVYSSQFCSDDQAETELRHSLQLGDDIECRRLKMKVGQLRQHWYKNCVAVGLSQGFIEPLEATALHLVQETVQAFIEHYQQADFSDGQRDKFNQSIYQRFAAVRDYIVAHYRVNSRSDTEYWRANANNNRISRSLFDILQVWLSGKNLSDELDRQKIDHYYPSVSWHCLLAGYGIYPTEQQLVAPNAQAAKYKLAEIQQFIRRCGLNFQSQRKLLAAQYSVT